jgi:hypothetical protein
MWQAGNEYGGIYEALLYERFLPLHERMMYSRYKIGLEFVQINIERTVKAERRSDGRDNLSDETVKV